MDKVTTTYRWPGKCVEIQPAANGSVLTQTVMSQAMRVPFLSFHEQSTLDNLCFQGQRFQEFP